MDSQQKRQASRNSSPRLRAAAQQFFTRLTGIKPVVYAMRLAIRIVVPRRRIGAAVALFNDQGEVLLLHHAFHGRYPWALPGGWVNRDEMPDAAVKRELTEETGMTMTLDKAIYFVESGPGHSVNVYFCATEPRGDIMLSFEANDARWFAIDQLPTTMLKRNHDAVKIAADYLIEQGKIPATQQ